MQAGQTGDRDKQGETKTEKITIVFIIFYKLKVHLRFNHVREIISAFQPSKSAFSPEDAPVRSQSIWRVIDVSAGAQQTAVPNVLLPQKLTLLFLHHYSSILLQNNAELFAV